MNIEAIKNDIKNSISFSIYGKSSANCDLCKESSEGGVFFCEIKMTRLSADNYNLILCADCIAKYKTKKERKTKL